MIEKDDNSIDPDPIKDEPISKFDEIEYQTLTGNLQGLLNLRVQLGTFFGTVNLAALAIAFSAQRSSPIIFAGILLWLFLYIENGLRRAFIVTVYRLIGIRHQNSLELSHEYLEAFLPGGVEEHQVLAIYDSPDRKDREKQLDRLTLFTGSKSGFLIPFFVSLFEITAGIMLWQFNAWPLF